MTSIYNDTITSVGDAQTKLMLALSVLDSDSDQSAAIVGGALLEEFLTRAISSRLVDDPVVLKAFLNFSGPIGTFSAKIEFGFLLGLYNQAMKKDLHYMRKIRNTFAHNTNVQLIRSGFLDNDIVQYCKNLRIVEHYISLGHEPAIEAPFRNIQSQQRRPTSEEWALIPPEYASHGFTATREQILQNMKLKFIWSIMALASYLTNIIINPVKPDKNRGLF